MTSVLLLSILGIFTNSWGIFQIQLMISNSTGAQKHALRLLKCFVWPRIYSILDNVTSAPGKRSVKLVVNVVFFLSIFETCMLNYLAIFGYLSQQWHKNLFWDSYYVHKISKLCPPINWTYYCFEIFNLFFLNPDNVVFSEI